MEVQGIKLRELATIALTITVSLPPLIYCCNLCDCAPSAKARIENNNQTEEKVEDGVEDKVEKKDGDEDEDEEKDDGSDP